MLAIFLVLLGSLIFIKPVFAGEPPIQISPNNGSTVSSSTLNWQAPSYPLYSTNPYRVQVDDDSAFLSSSINKDYYTKNTYYSPVLSEGRWYWRVKAKDASGVWSEWSSVWPFTLQSATPSPSPTPTEAPSPPPSSTSSSTTSSYFTISSIPSQINSDQSFNVSVSLSLPNNPNTQFYLKGAFKKADSSNYFGLTKVSGEWVKNGSTYSSQYPITTDASGYWSGNLEIKPDSEDSGFVGSSDYIFKVARYTSSGSGPTWSNNESTIKIISTESDNQGSAPINNPSSPSNPSTSSQPIKTKTTASNQTKNYDTLVYHNASVAAATTSANSSTSSAEVEVKNQRQTSPLVWIGLIFIFAGAGTVGYIYLKKNAKIHIPLRK